MTAHANDLHRSVHYQVRGVKERGRPEARRARAKSGPHESIDIWLPGTDMIPPNTIPRTSYSSSSRNRDGTSEGYRPYPVNAGLITYDMNYQAKLGDRQPLDP